MTTQVQKSIIVNVPVSTAYNQWTQFEDFPQFMSGVQSVTQLTDSRLKWVAEIAGVKREWEAQILEQVPDQKVAWAATEGATNAGAVRFEDLGGGQTRVHLDLEFEPEGLLEKAGDKLGVIERQAEGDLERFKKFIESEGYATGAWRGEVNAGAPVGTPGVEDAASSIGDSGKAGISGKAAAAAVGVAAAGVAAAAAAKKSGSGSETSETYETGTVQEGFDPGAPAGTPEAVTPVTATSGAAGTTATFEGDDIDPVTGQRMTTAGGESDDDTLLGGRGTDFNRSDEGRV